VYLHNQPATQLQETYQIYIDSGFDEQDKKEIIKAVDEWNLALNNSIMLSIEIRPFNMDIDLIQQAMSQPNTWIFMKVLSNNEYVTHLDTVKQGRTLAFTNKVSGNFLYVVRDRLEIVDLRPIVLHEIAHLLGVEHTGKWLMHPYYSIDRYYCIDQLTISKIADLHHLPKNKLNWCIRR